MIREEKRSQVEDEIRLRVDALMREELDLLKIVSDKADRSKSCPSDCGSRIALSLESCKIVPAKFQEFSYHFPKLADWLCMGWASCLAALRREISNMQE